MTGVEMLFLLLKTYLTLSIKNILIKGLKTYASPSVNDVVPDWLLSGITLDPQLCSERDVVGPQKSPAPPGDFPRRLLHESQ